MQRSELTTPAGEGKFSLHRLASALAGRLLVAALFALWARFPFFPQSQRAPQTPGLPAEAALAGSPRQARFLESPRFWSNQPRGAMRESPQRAPDEPRQARRFAPPGVQPPVAASERKGEKPTPMPPPVQHKERQRHRHEPTGMAPESDSPPPSTGATMPAPDDKATTLPPPGLGEPTDAVSGDRQAGQTTQPAPSASRGDAREPGRALVGMSAPEKD